jgi:ABC-type uncharacterized transport system permease subunit
MRSVVHLLPFQGLSHVPAEIFVEGAGVSSLALPIAWAVVLWVGGRVALSAARARLVVQGG